MSKNVYRYRMLEKAFRINFARLVKCQCLSVPGEVGKCESGSLYKNDNTFLEFF